MLFIIVLTAGTITIAQQSEKNAFMFDGITSRLYVYDTDSRINPLSIDEEDRDGFRFFNSSIEEDKITVQAWIYLFGSTEQMPIIYREVDEGYNTFSLYINNNQGYFSVGDGINSATVNTSPLPTFTWVALTATYDGSYLKIYADGELVSTSEFFDIQPGYTYSSEFAGLFVGKSSGGAFEGLIDEIRIFDIDLGENNINNSGGNGNPAEPFPSSLNQYLRGQWSFNQIFEPENYYLARDLSNYKNYLRIDDPIKVVPNKNIPFFVTSNLDDADPLPGDGSPVSYSGKVTLRSAIE
jgi:hypothetical protein